MELLIAPSLDVLSFFIKVAIVLIAILIILATAMKEKAGDKIVVKDLNKKFKNYKKNLWSALLTKKDLKKEFKKLEAENKKPKEKPKTYVLNFKGDIRASAVENLREEITALLLVAKPEDEVLLVLESPGGVVHGYGLAASQLQRVKEAGIRLVVCVDKVAASGGYMMACLADKIISAPFAIVGSVGVVAGVPNLHRVLKKNDVDYYQVTSGRFKRTVSVLGEITNDGLAKFKEEIEETHELFKFHVKYFRPKVDVERISTGEHWYGLKALELQLVDEIGTSDDYLLKASSDRTLKEIAFHGKKTLKEKLAGGMGMIFEKAFDLVLSKINFPNH